uniref:Uncharacterized protein n=1 Tax=Aegilops tauschii TaxID=37682 RepID=M8CHE2_AEGTA
MAHRGSASASSTKVQALVMRCCNFSTAFCSDCAWLEECAHQEGDEPAHKFTCNC